VLISTLKTGGSLLPPVKLLVFDLDGVITSEQIYLETARCTIQEILESDDYFGIRDYFGFSVPEERHFHPVEAIVSPRLVTALKTRAINSNWDLCYVGACLNIVGILRETQTLSHIAPVDKDLSLDRLLLAFRSTPVHSPLNFLQGDQTLDSFLAVLGNDLNHSPLDVLPAFIEDQLGTPLTCLKPRGELWNLCYEIFQDWMHQSRNTRYAASMPSLPFIDKTIVDDVLLADVLKHLRHSGYTLGIATGRPLQEARLPLENAGILSCFDPDRIVTYDEVQEAESLLMAQGSPLKLGKPHPFILLKAITPQASLEELLSADASASSPDAIMIGDSTADIIAARAAGCASIGVLTGLGWDEASFELKRRLLVSAGCDVVVGSVLDLPIVLGIVDAP